MSSTLAPASTDLVALVAAYVAAPELWAAQVRHDPEQRRFALLHRDADVEVWLVSWMPGHDTGFHDHDVSAAAVAVAAGRICEERLALGPPRAREYETGQVLTIPPTAIHRVQHAGEQPAVTIHAYSPPLGRMGQYVVGSNGVLERHAQDADEELKAAA